jgi:hypothetical protein
VDLHAVERGGVSAPAAMATQPAPRGPFLLLVVSGVRVPDPRGPNIIIYLHRLEALVLPLMLRRLRLGEEECFFTDVFVLAFVMFGRRLAPCSSATAT